MTTTADKRNRRLHRAARFEDMVHARVERRVVGRGWHHVLTGYTGYGASGWVRVLARVLHARPQDRSDLPEEPRRGWRSFITVQAVDVEVVVRAGDREVRVRSDRGGYIDVRMEADLPAGWQNITLSTEGGEDVEVSVVVVDAATRFGIVSDIDDTVMVTTLPRAMLAAWNTFVLTEHARRPVPGMAVLYERLAKAHPGAPVVYLSTGAWNVAPTLTRFLSRHLYPEGPLLLTDWGPTRDGWFRSGQAHKRTSLLRLASEFPDLKWLLIGDDGQHDPDLYSEFARSNPANVAAVAIRHLSPAEQVLASGLPVPMDQAKSVPGTPWVSGPDGASLSKALDKLDLV